MKQTQREGAVISFEMSPKANFNVKMCYFKMCSKVQSTKEE